MKRSAIALVGALAVGLVGGGTAYALTTTGQEPAAIETTASPTPTSTTTEDAPVGDEASPEPEASTEPTPDYITANDDEGFLAEVERRMIPGSSLGQFTDAELISFGYEGCKLIDEGVALEELQVVPDERRLPNEDGSWRDTSAVVNSSLLNYCPQLIEPKP